MDEFIMDENNNISVKMDKATEKNHAGLSTIRSSAQRGNNKTCTVQKQLIVRVMLVDIMPVLKKILKSRLASSVPEKSPLTVIEQSHEENKEHSPVVKEQSPKLKVQSLNKKEQSPKVKEQRSKRKDYSPNKREQNPKVKEQSHNVKDHLPIEHCCMANKQIYTDTMQSSADLEQFLINNQQVEINEMQHKGDLGQFHIDVQEMQRESLQCAKERDQNPVGNDHIHINQHRTDLKMQNKPMVMELIPADAEEIPKSNELCQKLMEQSPMLEKHQSPKLKEQSQKGKEKSPEGNDQNPKVKVQSPDIKEPTPQAKECVSTQNEELQIHNEQPHEREQIGNNEKKLRMTCKRVLDFEDLGSVAGEESCKRFLRSSLNHSLDVKSSGQVLSGVNNANYESCCDVEKHDIDRMDNDQHSEISDVANSNGNKLQLCSNQKEKILFSPKGSPHRRRVMGNGQKQTRCTREIEKSSSRQQLTLDKMFCLTKNLEYKGPGGVQQTFENEVAQITRSIYDKPSEDPCRKSIRENNKRKSKGSSMPTRLAPVNRTSFDCGVCKRSFLFEHGLRTHVGMTGHKKDQNLEGTECCREQILQPTEGHAGSSSQLKQGRAGLTSQPKKGRARSTSQPMQSASSAQQTNKHCQKKHRCQLCGKTFRNASRLRGHLASKHRDDHHLSSSASLQTNSDRKILPAQQNPNHQQGRPASPSQDESIIVAATSGAAPPAQEADRPHECNVCGARFRQHASLLVHGRVHSGATPYTCGTCGTGFAMDSQLIEHTRTHT